MTLRLLKSQIDALDFNYAEAVETFRQAKLAHRFTVDVPAPTAPAIVEQAVQRIPSEGAPDDYVTAYEIIDDTPPPPSVEELRTALINRARQDEMNEVNAIMSPGRRRLLDIEYQEAMSKLPEQQGPKDVAAISLFAEFQAKAKEIGRASIVRQIEIEDMGEEEVRRAAAN